MLTKDDKKWIGEEVEQKLVKYATKEDLAVSNIRLRTEMHKIRDELKGEISSKHDEVMTVLDKIMKEVVRGREHDLVIAHQVEKLNRRVFAD